MTEEKLVERVTALFADSDAAQRKMIRLYAETNDAIEASAIIDSGAEVLHMLQGGLRPEVLVLDSVLSDTTIFPLLRSIRQQQIEYEPHIIVTLMPSAAPQSHLSRVNAQKSKNNFQEARMRAISSRKSCSEHR